MHAQNRIVNFNILYWIRNHHFDGLTRSSPTHNLYCTSDCDINKSKKEISHEFFSTSFVQVSPQASSSAGPKVVKTPIATTTPEEHPSNGQYHPTAEKLAVRNKNRQGASHSSSAHHRRSGSHGSGNFNYLQQEGNSPRISPLRDRRVSVGWIVQAFCISFVFFGIAHQLVMKFKLRICICI